MTGITKDQALCQLKTSFPWLEELIQFGVVRFIPEGKPRHRLIDSDSLGNLREGEHYVVCPACGGWLGQINHKHTRSCLGLELVQYRDKYPGVILVSELATKLRAKTPAQREAQSQKLKARFQTSEGDVTRKQISEAAKQMQASESGQRSQNQLRRMNADPLIRAHRKAETKARWESGEARSQVEGWHRNNKELSNALIAKARQGNKRKRTKLHLGFKTLMETNGIQGFHTEYEIGYYAIDEANPYLKIALELDGCYWHSCPQCGLVGPNDTLRIDKSKTTFLTNRGWSVIRLWEHDINQDPMGCLERICQLIEDKERENHVG